MNWFEYLTNPEQLDVDLPKLDEDEKLRLLKAFVYEAGSCEKRRENGYDNNEDVLEQMNKSHILYAFSLKILANIRFNINLIHNWKMPLCLVGNLLRYFISISTLVPNFNPLQEVDWPGWNGVSRFAQVLYFFWTLLEGLDRVLIKPYTRCPTPPLPGLTDVPDIVFLNDNLLEEQNILKRLETCAQILFTILERDNIVFSIPTSSSFTIPDLEGTLTTETAIIGQHISTESMRSNILFFLGRHCFQRKEFDKAYNHFLSAKAAFDSSFNQLYFVGLNQKLMDSYLSLSKKLARTQPTRFLSAWEIIEDQIETKQWNIDQLTDILMNDLYHRFDFTVLDVLNGTVPLKDMSPLSLNLREKLERELISHPGPVSKFDMLKLSICNLLERIVCGQAVLTPLISHLANLQDEHMVRKSLDYLVGLMLKLWKLLINNSTTNNSNMSRTQSCPNIFVYLSKQNNENNRFKTGFSVEVDNLRCFIMFLAQTLPIEYDFPATLLNSELMEQFSTDDKKNISNLMNNCLIDLEDLEIDDLEDVECDWFTIHDKPGVIDGESNAFPVFANMQSNEADLLRLLTSYDGEEVKDILLRLQANGAANRNSITTLCDQWQLSDSMMEALRGLKSDFDYVYTYILLCKGKILRDSKSWDLARLLYDTTKNKINQHKIQKLIGYEITCCDLLKFLYTYQDLSPNNSTNSSINSDLIDRAKSSIASYSLESSNQIPDQLHVACCCLLLTLNEHDYITKLPITLSPCYHLSNLLVVLSRDFAKLNASTKFVKSAKDLFDTLLKIVTNQLPIINSNTLMSVQQLSLFIKLLGNRTLLDLIICGLVSILTCVRSDINLSKPLYPKDIWPTTISSNFSSAGDISSRLSDLVLMSLDKALAQNPYHSDWLLVRADLAMAEGDYHSALRGYLEAGAAETQFFTHINKTKNWTILEIYSEWALQQMARCCRETGRPELALLLAEQWCSDDINTTNNTSGPPPPATSYTYPLPPMTDFYGHLIHDSTLLEVLAAVDSDRGAVGRHSRWIELLSQPDINTNNDPELIQSTRERKTLELLRVISMQYLMR